MRALPWDEQFAWDGEGGRRLGYVGEVESVCNHGNGVDGFLSGHLHHDVGFEYGCRVEHLDTHIQTRRQTERVQSTISRLLALTQKTS